MYFNLFLIHIIYKNNPKYKTHIMKKVILTISIGVALASCSSGWNCKKRYCDTQKKDIIKTQYITNAQLELVANP